MRRTTKLLICIALCGVIYLCTPSARACEAPGPCYDWNPSTRVWEAYGCVETPCTEDCEYCNESSCVCEPTCVDPVAEFDVGGFLEGEDVVVLLGTELTFDGSDSCDDDGTTLLYSWTFGDGCTDGPWVSVSHTYEDAGEYTAQLVVLDSDYTECDEDCPNHLSDPAYRSIRIVEPEVVVEDGDSVGNDGDCVIAPMEVLDTVNLFFVQVAANDFRTAAEAFGIESLDPADLAAFESKGGDLIAALNTLGNTVNNYTPVAGSTTVSMDPGDFSFIVREANNEPVGISVSISLASSGWTTTKSFGDEIWSSFSPTSASVGYQVCSGDLNGNGGTITATITVDDYDIADLTWEKSFGVETDLLEENATLDLKAACLASKLSIEQWTTTWANIESGINFAKEVANGVGALFPIAQPAIGVVNAAVGAAQIGADFAIRNKVDDMHDANKDTFAEGRTEIEAFAEEFPEGGSEDRTAQEDITDFELWYQ